MEGVPPYSKEEIKKYRKLHLWWDITIGEALDRMATLYSYRTMVVDEAKRLTYEEVNNQATKLALILVEMGLNPGDTVLMQLPNIVEFCVAYLAFQKIGVVPIMGVPRHAQKEMIHFGNIAGAKAWIGPASYRKTNYLEMLPGLKEGIPSLKLIILVEDGVERPGYLSYNKLLTQVHAGHYSAASLEKYNPDPNEVALLLPTGGTTGLPKLVPRTHNNYICNAYFSCTRFDKTPRDADLVVTPIAHNAGMQRLMYRLVIGGKLVLGNSTRPKDILEMIQKERATSCFTVPALLIDLLNEPDREKYDLSSLCIISSGGAFLAPETLRQARKTFKCHVVNNFGMAEGPCIGPRVDYPEEEILYTVGKAHCPWEHYVILDEEGREAPQGQEGELAAKGPLVFTGYYKAEEANRKSFTMEGYFRSGDLARINDRGNFIITGRSKDLINRGGEKISAEEVEEMLITMEGVSSVAAVSMPDSRLGEKVCVYIKLKDNARGPFNVDAVTAHMKTMGASVLLLPERVEIIDEIPLTPIGKIDKKILRQKIAEKLEKEGK